MSNRNKAVLFAVSMMLAAMLALAGCGAAPAVNAPVAANSAAPAANENAAAESPAPTATMTQESNPPAVKVIDIEGNEIIANKMTVSATGTKKVMPDVAYVTVGATTQNKSMSKAQSQNRDIMNALTAAIKTAGLTDDDIETISYSVYPMYDYTNGTGTITGYEVSNMIRLTVKDIDKVGDYIDVAAANGANTNYSINFDLEDSTQYYNEALANAMTKAKGKADAIAEAGGYELKGTLEITESQAYYAPEYREYDAAAKPMADEASTPVSAGQLEITATVTVVYQIN